MGGWCGVAAEPILRVLIADDHPIFRAGLKIMLDAMPGIEVVGEAQTGRAAVEQARRLRPDIVLMDLEMPEMDGIAATRAIVRECPESVVLILTMLEELDSVMAAVRAGARGYLLKGSGADDIVRAVEAVGKGEAIFGQQIARQVVNHLSKREEPKVPFPELTNREREVLRLVANGAGNATIARELDLSIKTVRNYLSRIFVKLQVTHRTEAAVRARRAGLGI
jgi:DNA-binding NarL/FixJ family response regulator